MSVNLESALLVRATEFLVLKRPYTFAERFSAELGGDALANRGAIEDAAIAFVRYLAVKASREAGVEDCVEPRSVSVIIDLHHQGFAVEDAMAAAVSEALRILSSPTIVNAWREMIGKILTSE